MKFDIIIAGAGASGLAAAYQAAVLQPKLNILVLEKEKVPGRKLSAAGNGKCNLTNMEFTSECYHSGNHTAMEQWVMKHSYEEIPVFFESLGLLLYEKNGYYYPVSNQGKQVTRLLYEKSRKAGVQYDFETKVTGIEPRQEKSGMYYVVTGINGNGSKVVYHARYVILALGGAAAPKLGGSCSGYELIKKLHLKYNPIYPALSPIYIDDPLLSIAKGVRLDASVTLYDGRQILAKENGQIQFNEKSLSGIVIMNLSCYLNAPDKQPSEACLHIDALPGFSWNRLKDFMICQRQNFPEESIECMLGGILPDPFVNYILRRLQLEQGLMLCNMKEKQIDRLVSSLKKIRFKPVFKEDYEKAQVTGGGTALEEIFFDSFSCKKYENLYITGELLDIYGKCGGYNLTFAVLSGIQAVKDIYSRGQ